MRKGETNCHVENTCMTRKHMLKVHVKEVRGKNKGLGSFV